MATYFNLISIKKEFHSKVILALLVLLSADDNVKDRFVGRSGTALVNFFKKCPQEKIISYLETVVNKIEKLLKKKVEEVSA